MRFALLVCVASSMVVACSDSEATPVMPVTETPGAAGSSPGVAGSGAGGTPAGAAGKSGTPAAGSGGPAAPTAGASGQPMMPTMPMAGGEAEAGSGPAMPVAGASGMGAAAGEGGPMADAGMPGEPEPQNCDAATGMPGRSVQMVENAGVTRRYILYVPDSYTGDKPVPLMLNFHPLLTDAATAENSSMYKRVADQEGFIVAFPDGQESAAWNVGPCCTQSREVDDVGFARAIVAKVESEYCVDKKRVYASGYSMGGGMAHYLACEAADLFAAVATGHFDLMAENTCEPARPITVFSIRSMTDTIVPYEGGVKQDAPNGFRGMHTFLGAVDTFEKWAEINGCTGEPVSEGGCQIHKQCTDGVEVTLCNVGGGHLSWPDAERSWQAISGFTLP